MAPGAAPAQADARREFLCVPAGSAARGLAPCPVTVTGNTHEARKQRFRELGETAGRRPEFQPPQTNPWESLTQGQPKRESRPVATAAEDVRGEFADSGAVRPEFVHSGAPIRAPTR